MVPPIIPTPRWWEDDELEQMRSDYTEGYLGENWEQNYRAGYGDRLPSDEEIVQRLETMGSYV
jgi:hypothetical protein